MTEANDGPAAPEAGAGSSATAGDVDDVRVVDNPADERYEIHLGDRLAGISTYDLDGDVITFLHTEVDQHIEGRGLGSRLAAGALADARARGLRVRAECPFIGSYLRRHRAEYADLVDRR